MQSCSVSGGYRVDLMRLLQRRLGKGGVRLSGGPETVHADIAEEADFRQWCGAVAGVLLYDIAHFELAQMVNELPISLEEKRRVLTEAVQLSRAVGDKEALARELAECFHASGHLDLEGFVRFRMRSVRRDWEACVARAAEELLLKNEYAELMQVLSAFVRLPPPRARDVYVIINPDGSCTLTDDQDSRIDCAATSTEGVMRALVGLSPERITVYDLSGGCGAEFAQTLIRVFEDRVRFFR